MSTVEIVSSVVAEAGNWCPLEGRFTIELKRRLIELGDLPSPESFERVRTEAVRILGSCLPPWVGTGQRTGLVVGSVQSGKTMSITAVTALARDNDFRCIVVLAGTATNLVQQTQERLEEHLGTDHWLMLPNPTQSDKGDIVGCINEWGNPRFPRDQLRGVLCVVMKHKTHIDNLTKLLSAVALQDVNALIFDDEADQAGLNTKPDTGVSPIYNSIKSLRKALSRHTYLQYTATPQAPLLITLLDTLSPDFADTIDPGEGYVGGRDFFVEARGLICEIIDEGEPAEDDQIPSESLRKSLRLFFLGAAATRVLAERDPSWAKERYRSMLVHPSRQVGPHKDYAKIIEEIKRDWTDLLSRDEADDERAELTREFAESHADLKATFASLPVLEELTQQLLIEVSRARVTIVNKDGSDVPWKRHNTHILVGGQKLDRGYTVRGLTVTHMAREPGAGNYDTIQQRARFFGYKRKYLGLCRVFLQPEVHDAFKQYVFHEEVLRDALRRHRGQDLRTWKRMFAMAPGYRLTRPNVHTEDYFRPSRGEWFKQQGPHLLAADVIKANNEVLLRFANSLPTVDSLHWSRYGHKSATIPLQDVQRLLSDLVPGGEEDLRWTLVAQFALEVVQRDWAYTDAMVLLMAWDRAPRRRTLRKDSLLIELHQGPTGSGADDTYPGDTQVRDEQRVTVQLHRVQVELRDGSTGPLVLALTLRLPSHYTSDGFVFQPKRQQR